jgi:tetratricopeptide (TPR) repeat protein
MVRMSRLTGIGLSLILGLAFVTRAFAQGNENNDWQKIDDERDARRKAELIEKFVKDYPNSAHRPDADFALVDYYQSNKDNGKIMQHAESFRLTVPSADNAAKSKIYTQAMLAAATLNNVAKTAEYGGYALQADPNNLTVLVFLAGNNLPDPAKALEHAQKAVSVSRPAAMTEAQFTTMQGRMHGVLANSFFAQQKFVEAAEHYAVALKSNPKDHGNQFRFAFSSVTLAGAAANAAQIANNDLIKAMSATPTDAAKVEEAKAKVDAASKQALTHRDNAVDAMAKAVALGGQYATQAKQLLDSLYKNKTGSLDGEDQYIAQKKTELGL